MAVSLTRVDEFALVTIDRPDALNALSFALIRELGGMFDAVGASDARGLIVTGAGPKAFSAGADIAELAGRPVMANRAGAELGQQVFAKLDALPVPSIAVINGFAFGGGLELALACTFRLALSSAKMGLPEIKLGLIPGYGGTQRLPRLIGEGRALELIMTGRTVEAEEALRIGLVNRLVPEGDGGDPVAAGVAFGRELGRYGLPALRLARDAVKRALDLPLAEGLKVEADLSTLAYATDDAKEGMAAFLAKRKPAFKDG